MPTALPRCVEGAWRLSAARSVNRRGRAKPGWYLIATDDKMIPPDAQGSLSKRAGSTVDEVKGSHAIYVSQPEAVAAPIEQAAKSVKTSAAA
jgi:hypothetical protein